MKSVGVILILSALLPGFVAVYAYGFWSAGWNPTAEKFTLIAAGLLFAGMALLIAGLARN